MGFVIFIVNGAIGNFLQLWRLREENLITGTGDPVDAIISSVLLRDQCGIHNVLKILYDNQLDILMEAGYISGTFFYTTLCNALDYMASCIPVTYVDPNNCTHSSL